VLLTATALALGFLHGLGADHLMAIASLAIKPRTGRPGPAPFDVAVRFALGHAVLLLAGSALVLLVGWQIPEVVEQTGERVGGLLLIGMGLFTLWVVASDRLYGHSHGHAHDGHTHPAPDAPHGDHVHWHLHFGRRDRHPSSGDHAHGAGVLGAVFAISGLRALTLLAPTLHGSATNSFLMLIYLVAVFAVGILLSMSLFGIVLTRLLGSPFVVRTVGRSAAAATALASIGLGMYWLMG
jgi:ABC-type nickel/cobalt efflux system permease component RcnA